MPGLQEYQCHKKVRAAKIKSIEQEYCDSFKLVFEGTEKIINVNLAYMDKHNPYSGGYYVVYDDGYQSFSPAEAFENGYTIIE